MVSYPQTDMKIPVRPAPAPPASRPNQTFQRSSSFFDSWDDGNDPFSNGNISRSFSAQNISPAQTVKKKPPPRPPPPKINNYRHNHPHNSKQNKANVLTGLFSRSNQRFHSSNATSHKHIVGKDNIHVASLIDFDSPSSSPTFTTRSSSDGVSVNSFGSDGSASNNGNTPSGGTASLFESGFEDDFDFFGGLTNNNVKTPVSEQKDPWSVSPQDPFSPPRTKQPETVSNAGSSTWFNDISGNQNNVPNCVDVLKPPAVSNAMPTIIRAKPSRPPAPPKLLQSSKDPVKQTNVGLMQNSSLFFHNTDMFDSSKSFSFPDPESSREWSPPMPTVPPPPPPQNINPNDIPITLPDLPPRKSPMGNKKIPHGIALYDYSTSHPDDLIFKCNDIIHILKRINNEWLYGEIGDHRGMFPANFIEVIVPLDESSSDKSGSKAVTALYPFFAQQWDDLEFPEGAVIEVLSQINADWLYGEYQGKKGQFPSSFIDHVPPGLPQQKLS